MRRDWVAVLPAGVIGANVERPDGGILIGFPRLSPVGDRRKVLVEGQQTGPQLPEAVAVQVGVEVVAGRVAIAQTIVVEDLLLGSGHGGRTTGLTSRRGRRRCGR